MRLVALGLLACLASPVPAAEAVLSSETKWFIPVDEFGGFSGIEVSADGRTFTVISDRGRWISGKFVRNNGRITDVRPGSLAPIKDLNGLPVAKYRVDAEGLAAAADGTMFISFEGAHRVRQYTTLDQDAKRLKSHAGFKEFQNNSGMEALAIDADGALYTLPERSGDWERPFPVFRYEDGAWQRPFSIPRRDKHLPVGADFGPDGKFYLLERDFVWYKGFSSRIRRFELTEAGFENEEILLTSDFGDYDNLEGISAWLDEAGQIRLTAISDDNFNALQTTQFVEFLVVE